MSVLNSFPPQLVSVVKLTTFLSLFLLASDREQIKTSDLFFLKYSVVIAIKIGTKQNRQGTAAVLSNYVGDGR